MNVTIFKEKIHSVSKVKSGHGLRRGQEAHLLEETALRPQQVLHPRPQGAVPGRWWAPQQGERVQVEAEGGAPLEALLEGHQWV